MTLPLTTACVVLSPVARPSYCPARIGDLGVHRAETGRRLPENVETRTRGKKSMEKVCSGFQVFGPVKP